MLTAISERSNEEHKHIQKYEWLCIKDIPISPGFLDSNSGKEKYSGVQSFCVVLNTNDTILSNNFENSLRLNILHVFNCFLIFKGLNGCKETKNKAMVSNGVILWGSQITETLLYAGKISKSWVVWCDITAFDSYSIITRANHDIFSGKAGRWCPN